MKLLALHGHLQNAKKFKSQTGALAGHLKKIGIQLVYIDGPIVKGEGEDGQILRTWVDDKSETASFDAIIKAKNENPDAIGIFGFSMGAMLALQLAAHASMNADSPFSWIKLIVAVSAPFPADDSPLHNFFPCQCSIPVLFVVGAGDQIAPPESQMKYFENFKNSKVFNHEGGHYVPSARKLIQPYLDFFEEFKKNFIVQE